MDEVTQSRSQKISETQTRKAEARKKIVALGEGKWNIVQRFLMAVQADCILKAAIEGKPVEFREQYELLKSRLEKEYAEQPDIKEAVFEYLPTARGCLNWTKLSSWNDEVTAILRKNHLFSPEKRAEIITGLGIKAAEGDVQAAKVWLTMSGDYTDKVDVGDAKFEKYKEYATVLSRSKNDSDLSDN